MSFLNRMINVMKADVATFDEIEHDPAATTQAAIIVGVVGLIGAIGATALAGQTRQILESLEQLEGVAESIPGFAAATGNISTAGIFISTLVGAFVTWGIWSWLTAFVGVRFFNGKADTAEMLRVLGFARIPGVLSIVPCLGFIGWLWSLYLGFVAVREGLDIDGGKALLTILISLIPAWIISGLISSVIGAIF